jgi:hypothetical protein
MAILIDANRRIAVRRSAMFVVCVAAALPLLGCGGGSGATTNVGSSGSTDGSHAAFLARVDRVCAQAVARHAGHQFPVVGFDPEHPDPAQLPAVADYFAKYGGLGTTTAGLHRVAPPSGDIAGWQDLLGLADRVTSNAQRQIAAGRARDVAAFVTAVHTANDLIGRLNAAASRLGFADTSPCHQVYG